LTEGRGFSSIHTAEENGAGFCGRIAHWIYRLATYYKGIYGARKRTYYPCSPERKRKKKKKVY
jgi:hypothetical protein